MSLDKLYLASDSKLNKQANDLIKSQPQMPYGDKHYKEVYQVKVHDSLVMVKTNPRCSFGNATETRIELNPSHFKSWDQAFDAVSFMVDPDSAVIKRIDHAVDMHIPLQVVHESVRVKFKQDFVPYWETHKREVMTGMYFGNKPEAHCYYDKGFSILGPRKAKRVPGNNVGVTTRFEVRQFKQKIQYPRLLDIQRYSGLNPFENIQFFEIDQSAIGKRADALKQLLPKQGLRGLYNELNRDHNAMRVLKDLKQRDLAAELYEGYRDNLRQYFNDESKVEENGGKHES